MKRLVKPCNALGIAAGDQCRKPVGHDGPHEGVISAFDAPARSLIAAAYSALLDLYAAMEGTEPFDTLWLEMAPAMNALWRLAGASDAGHDLDTSTVSGLGE